jgi:hypothetical protein
LVALEPFLDVEVEAGQPVVWWWQYYHNAPVFELSTNGD